MDPGLRVRVALGAFAAIQAVLRPGRPRLSPRHRRRRPEGATLAHLLAAPGDGGEPVASEG